MTHDHEYTRVAVYQYNGARKIKYACPCGAKQFKWQREVSPGVYVSGRSGIDPGLYAGVPSPRLADDRIWVVEGEKDVEALATRGEVAVSPPDGAGSWTSEYSTRLLSAAKSRDILVVSDADDAGRRHAADVRKSLLSVVPDAVVLLVETESGKDVFEFLSGGGTVEQLARRAYSRTIVRSFANGLAKTFQGCKLRNSDPAYRGRSFPRLTWTKSDVPRSTRSDTFARPDATVDPYATRVRCGQCGAYLMVVLKDKKTRDCWRCRDTVEIDGETKFVPLRYKTEES